jgi:hypothetical protein
MADTRTNLDSNFFWNEGKTPGEDFGPDWLKSINGRGVIFWDLIGWS